MPLPSVKKNEKESQYMQRCMTFLGDEKRPQEQKVAMCLTTFRNSKKSKAEDSSVMEEADFKYSCAKYVEEFSEAKTKYQYKNMKTGEVYTYDKKGSYTKDGNQLVFLGEATDNTQG